MRIRFKIEQKQIVVWVALMVMLTSVPYITNILLPNLFFILSGLGIIALIILTTGIKEFTFNLKDRDWYLTWLIFLLAYTGLLFINRFPFDKGVRLFIGLFSKVIYLIIITIIIRSTLLMYIKSIFKLHVIIIILALSVSILLLIGIKIKPIIYTTLSGKTLYFYYLCSLWKLPGFYCYIRHLLPTLQ